MLLIGYVGLEKENCLMFYLCCYYYSYKTSNGLTREETGEVVNLGKDDEHIVVRGVYSYIDTDGVIQSVSYTADENGYHINTPSGTVRTL